MNKESKKVPWMPSQMVVVLFILAGVVFLIAKDIKDNNVKDKCSCETEAYLVDERIEEYLYARTMAVK